MKATVNFRLVRKFEETNQNYFHLSCRAVFMFLEFLIIKLTNSKLCISNTKYIPVKFSKTLSVHVYLMLPLPYYLY